jgi:hypothetical protein
LWDSARKDEWNGGEWRWERVWIKSEQWGMMWRGWPAEWDVEVGLILTQCHCQRR